MTKSELVKVVAENLLMPQTKVDAIVDCLIATITETLKKGEQVAIAKFATFTVSDTAERQGRNPSTGAALTIPASKRVNISASSTLKNAVK